MAIVMGLRMRWRGLLALAALLGGCASVPAPPSPPPPQWSGRLALVIHTDPVQRASAGFDLRGWAQRGELWLHGPLGQTLAQVHWNEDGAWLERPDAPAQRYPDVGALTEALTGAALPLATLLDWLQGRPSEAPGWSLLTLDADQGRLQALRHSPQPRVELRLVWQRP